MKLLVTGATGFLGSTLVPLLRAAGHEVRALTRSGAPIAEVEIVKGDVRDPDAVRRALSGVEGLYHLAGLVSRDPADARKMYELHVDGTRNLLAAAARAKLQRIVLASSSGTIGVSRVRRVATEEELSDFLATWPNVDPQTGLNLRGDDPGTEWGRLLRFLAPITTTGGLLSAFT